MSCSSVELCLVIRFWVGQFFGKRRGETGILCSTHTLLHEAAALHLRKLCNNKKYVSFAHTKLWTSVHLLYYKVPPLLMINMSVKSQNNVLFLDSIHAGVQQLNSAVQFFENISHILPQKLYRVTIQNIIFVSKMYKYMIFLFFGGNLGKWSTCKKSLEWLANVYCIRHATLISRYINYTIICEREKTHKVIIPRQRLLELSPYSFVLHPRVH